ncbi:hypothetical protein C4559_04905 [Candidatus Microgenomates bacterium]|nr:MAG: hypothetical protein C4559_04905 [Candidatus Microgenomates bacterium]
MDGISNLEKFGKALEGIGNKKITRRTALKTGLASALTIAGLNTACDERSYNAEDLLNFRSSEKWKEPNPAWQSKRTIHVNDTLSKIAAQVYPGFGDNQLFYIGILRLANQQDKIKNASLFPDQKIYIPHPAVPTFGFAPNEQLVLKGEKVNGQDLPTKIEEIDFKKRTFVYSYNGRKSQPLPLKEGIKIATSRGLKVAAVLEGIGSVPPRVVFELTQPQKI